ncbi:hypothetical protein NE237_022028 [Protea cynaroides]|uniref:Uncharacterized protein n=1 Tax=Protea cynaroides TaxID=273540 RepID=A0A9Q0K5F6_9MAGN|nr:hypothetical protein NE237_022028 [Protea cynaroides]
MIRIIRWTQGELLLASSSSSSYRSVSQSSAADTRCCDRAVESAVSAGVLCVCCPLAVVWCCVKLPCKIGWRSARRAIDYANCCGSERKVISASSSFSDIDFDCPSSGQLHTCPKNRSAGLNTRKSRTDYRVVEA